MMETVSANEQRIDRETIWESDVYTLLIVREQTLAVQSADSLFSVNPREALLLQPGQRYVLSPEAPVLVYQFEFSREAFFQFCLPVLEGCALLSEFFVHEQQSTIGHLHFEGLSDEMMALAAQMCGEYARHDNYYDMVLLCSLMKLLLQLSRSCTMNAVVTRQPGTQLAQKIMAYIVANCAATSLTEVAAHFNYHPNTISGVIRKHTGMSFQAVRQQMRLSHAAKLIAQNGYSVTQAARESGYHNMSNFYAQFTREFGVRPGEYMQLSNENNP